MAQERESENMHLPHSSSCPSTYFPAKIVVVIAPYGHWSVCVPEFKKKNSPHTHTPHTRKEKKRKELLITMCGDGY